MPVRTWACKNSPDIRHIGLTQDFRAAFGVGMDDKHIATVDADGVRLAAIPGPHQVMQEKDGGIAALKAKLAEQPNREHSSPRLLF